MSLRVLTIFDALSFLFLLAEHFLGGILYLPEIVRALIFSVSAVCRPLLFRNRTVANIFMRESVRLRGFCSALAQSNQRLVGSCLPLTAVASAAREPFRILCPLQLPEECGQPVGGAQSKRCSVKHSHSDGSTALPSVSPFFRIHRLRQWVLQPARLRCRKGAPHCET